MLCRTSKNARGVCGGSERKMPMEASHAERMLILFYQAKGRVDFFGTHFSGVVT
jgi:hypothetical protein